MSQCWTQKSVAISPAERATARKAYDHARTVYQQLIAESVAMQLEKRVAFRRAMRKAVESALRFGALGIKLQSKVIFFDCLREKFHPEKRVPHFKPGKALREAVDQTE